MENKNIGHKEYNCIAQKTGTPYIILFIHSIFILHTKHKAQGLKETLLHEFFHFKQWLENTPLKHNSILKAIDKQKDLYRNLKVISEALNKGG
jgi:hypothetical protein